jgi:hypothetical protein
MALMTETIQVEEKPEKTAKIEEIKVEETVKEQQEKVAGAEKDETVVCPQVRATRKSNERIRKMGDGVGVLSLYNDFD